MVEPEKIIIVVVVFGEKHRDLFVRSHGIRQTYQLEITELGLMKASRA